MQTCRTTSFLFVNHISSHFVTHWLKMLRGNLTADFRRSVFAPIGVLVLLVLAHPGQAQVDKSVGISEETESSRGYWRLKTQAATRSTGVQFFGPNGQLLYEEIIPGKWIKLSRKNQKQVDRLLAQLVANQLVTSRIRTELLPATPVEPLIPNGAARSNSTPNSSPGSAAYLVHAYVNQSGKLYVVVNNPDRLRYKILVADQRNRSLYEEFTNHDQYRRRLDLSALPQDAFQVIVEIDHRSFLYTVKRQEARFAFTLQPDSVARKALTRRQEQERKQLPMPVTVDL